MHRPFEWGRSDCSTSACDVFAALWGVDPLAPWRGAYDSALSAARLIRRMGGHEALAIEMARRAGLRDGEAIGAIGIAGRTLVICVRPGVWAGKTETGLAVVRAVDRAWHA